MIDQIFDWVYLSLKWCEAQTGFSYREINIIVFYILIPYLFCTLLDLYFKYHRFKIYFTILLCFAAFLIQDFKQFSSWAFDKSVFFLNWFSIIGLNYTEASVVICVFFPLLVIGMLTYINKK